VALAGGSTVTNSPIAKAATIRTAARLAGHLFAD
jgi:hypothetical protein